MSHIIGRHSSAAGKGVTLCVFHPPLGGRGIEASFCNLPYYYVGWHVAHSGGDTCGGCPVTACHVATTITAQQMQVAADDCTRLQRWQVGWPRVQGVEKMQRWQARDPRVLEALIAHH
ncbi:hypothetical protein Tco_0776673 [Tanacetum coccineum]